MGNAWSYMVLYGLIYKYNIICDCQKKYVKSEFSTSMFLHIQGKFLNIVLNMGKSLTGVEYIIT